MARVYSRFLPRFMPGNPTIVVANKPGAGSTIGGNYVYQSKPDGLNALVSTTSPRFAYAFGSSAAKYDLKKMPTAIAIRTGIAVFMKAGMIDKPEDIVGVKGLRFGHSSGSVSYVFSMVKELIGFPADRVILGYGGAADALRAFLAGEINTTGAAFPAYISSVVPLVK
ncbi:MAG: hypothetical protein HYX90_07945 [Chloroflexi bacterium]|nr:hypothetical protein [Chloroflexota bacterium]